MIFISLYCHPHKNHHFCLLTKKNQNQKKLLCCFAKEMYERAIFFSSFETERLLRPNIGTSRDVPSHTPMAGPEAMVPLPLVKLIGLAVKQFISKPLATFLKSQVKTKPFLRNRVCIPIGRFHHNNQVGARESL